MQALPDALSPLGFYKQFIVYKLVPRNDGTGKVDKLPVDPRTGRVMTKKQDWQNDPNLWVDSTTAINAAQTMGGNYGAGFFFTADDPFIFIDIDGALDTAGNWSPVAVDLCTRFNGAAVELSQSGTGLHIIGMASSVPAHGCKNAMYGLELYHERRFVALTGNGAIGNTGADVTAVLADVVPAYFSPSGGLDDISRPAMWTTTPRPEYTGPADDNELLAMMFKSGSTAAQVLGGKASIIDLWKADPEVLARSYPDYYGQRPFDASSADAALAAHLAFWTGGDCERVERLMWRSGLVRDKWTTHPTYLREFTITKAVARCQTVYTGGQRRQLSDDAVTLDLPFHAGMEATQFIAIRERRLLRFNGAWFTREPTGYYREIDDELIRSEVRTACAWTLTPSKVNAALDELKSLTVIDSHGVKFPHWLRSGDGFPNAEDLIVCQNGILDPSTGVMYEHTDNLLTFNALPFDYNPSAPVPSRWLTFLEEAFGGDHESIRELKKLAGYLITLDTSMQKIFAVIGPKRSGKGTIARILRELIGVENTCSPSFNTVGGDFGLESFVGKQVAIFPDARIGRRTDKTIVAERLLSISGEDALDISRKHKSAWHGKLSTRLIIFSNEVPVFGDASGALASRYVVFHTPNSFYGREDRGLTDKLKDELPGILNWALEGLHDLRREGSINTPEIARDMVDEIDSLGSPVKGYIKDRCRFRDGAMVAKDALWMDYKRWHHENGLSSHPLSKEMFLRNLKTAYPHETHEFRPRMEDGSRPYYLARIELVNQVADQVMGNSS